MIDAETLAGLPVATRERIAYATLQQVCLWAADVLGPDHHNAPDIAAAGGHFGSAGDTSTAGQSRPPELRLVPR